MKRPARVSRQGQSLVIVTLLLFALMGMLALALDGGNGLFQRRIAQNAADAGALAGARELCVNGGDESAAEYVAVDYAIDRNGADAVTIAWPEPGVIQVATVITFPTTFGNVLGMPEMTAHAVAAAGCFAPGAGEGILPVAWSCKAGDPVVEPGVCDVNGYEGTFIIMDSETASTDHCYPIGLIDCDFDDDGQLDLLVGGDRSWLDVNGADNSGPGCAGAGELGCWIEGGYSDTVFSHTWAPEQSGVAVGAIFDAAYDTYDPRACTTRCGATLILPVFDVSCDGDPQDPVSCGLWHDGEDVMAGGTPCPSGQSCFHIITFAGFVIDCVSTGPGATKACPKKTEAMGFPGSGIDNNTRTIEGHFVTGFVPNVQGRPADGVDAGIWTLYLVQ